VGYVLAVGGIAFRGGEGGDALSLDDRADPFSNDYTLESGNSGRAFAYRNSSLTVAYEGFEGLGLQAGAGTNHVYVKSTLAETPVTVTTGSGRNDVILNSQGSVAGSGTADKIRSVVTVKGKGTADTVHVGDYKDSTADQVTITEDSVGGGAGDTLFGGGRLVYSALEGLNVNLSLDVKDAG
jgi:hypothetical protein